MSSVPSSAKAAVLEAIHRAAASASRNSTPVHPFSAVSDFLSTSYNLAQNSHAEVSLFSLLLDLPRHPDFNFFLFPLLTFHVVYLIFLTTSNLPASALFTLFSLNLAITRWGLPLANDFFAKQWKELGISANYFDTDGFFITLLVGGPLLLANLLVLLRILKQTSELLIRVKKKEYWRGLSNEEMRKKV